MLGWFNEWRKKQAQQKAYAAFRKEHRFVFEDGRLTINGAAVSEFGPLLRLYSDGKFDSFDDFPGLASAAPAINRAIAKDLLLPQTRSEQVLGISRETAKGNLGDLKLILKVVEAYVRMAKENDLPLRPRK